MSINRFSPPPPLKHLQDDAKKALLVVLRDKAAPILANNLLPHFTDHSVTHSDNLAQFVDQLIEPLQSGDYALNEQELVALYSACYLHDIGMQYENAGTTQVISRLSLPQRWGDLSEDTRRTLLRKHHAEISAEMIMMSVRAEAPIIGLQLTVEYLPRYVAALCEAHTLPTESERYQQLTKDGPKLRMSLLSGLLRLADILDLSRRRATREKARTLSLDLESQTHWWRHYYTEEITIDQAQKIVCLWFDFPKERLTEYSKVVPPLQMPWVEAEFSRHMTVFHRYGLGWSITSKVEEKPYSDAELMPEVVMTEMLKQLARQRKAEEERHRHIVSQQFVEAQPQINRRLNELETLKSTITSDEYLRELTKVAVDLSELGGKRSAWMLLSSEYERGASTLEPAERLKIGSTLAEMMLKDGDAKRAAYIIKELLPLVDGPTSQNSEKIYLMKLWCTCLVEVGAYSEAAAAIEQTIGLISENREKEELQAQLAELHFFYGQIDVALSSSIFDGDKR